MGESFCVFKPEAAAPLFLCYQSSPTSRYGTLERLLRLYLTDAEMTRQVNVTRAEA
jgi:hypothetical protein